MRGVVCVYTSEGDWGEEIIQGDELNVECSHMQRDCMTREMRSVFYKPQAHIAISIIFCLQGGSF